jgi:SAM-dependent methyltransferase
VAESSADDWDQHWAEFGAAAELGPTPKYRRHIIFRLLQINAQEKSARMLEIGSGTGEFAEEFCRRYPGIRYLGLELSRIGVEFSSRRVPKVLFLQRDLLQPAESDEFLDFGATYAVCSEVLEHVDEPRVLLRNASRYMAPGCKLIVTVPGGPMNAFYRHIGHRRHYTSRELRELLRTEEFEIEQTYSAGFPFFNLFQLVITWRGDKLAGSIAGPPSRVVRFGMWLFDALFRFNLMRWGWQTIAVARYRGAE